MRIGLLGVLCAVVAISFLGTAPASGAIINSGFEDGLAPWRYTDAALTGCDHAGRLRPVALGPEDGQYAAILGDLPSTVGQSGCDPTGIYQDFASCGPDAGTICYVQFDALLVWQDNETVIVTLRTSTTPNGVAYRIPPGSWQNLSVAVPGCSTARVGFAIYEGIPDGIQSTLVVDNVTSWCSPVAAPDKALTQCTDADCLAAGDLFDNPPTTQLPNGADQITGACCGAVCLQVMDELCASLAPAWKYRGDGSECATACPDPIPAVTEWGMAALVLLVVAAGTVVLMRRRTAAA